MAESERIARRKTALLGFVFGVALILVFIGGSTVVGINTNYLDAPYHGEVEKLFPNSAAADYPFLSLVLFMGSLPPILGAGFTYMKITLIVPATALFARNLLQFAATLAGALSLSIAAMLIQAELYTTTYADFIMFIRLNQVFFYLLFLMMGLLQIGFGLSIRNTPLQSLGYASIIFGGLSLFINLLSPNYDLPSLRVSLRVVPLAADIVIWSAFLWIELNKV